MHLDLQQCEKELHINQLAQNRFEGEEDICNRLAATNPTTSASVWRALPTSDSIPSFDSEVGVAPQD